MTVLLFKGFFQWSISNWMMSELKWFSQQSYSGLGHGHNFVVWVFFFFIWNSSFLLLSMLHGHAERAGISKYACVQWFLIWFLLCICLRFLIIIIITWNVWRAKAWEWNTGWDGLRRLEWRVFLVQYTDITL